MKNTRNATEKEMIAYIEQLTQENEKLKQYYSKKPPTKQLNICDVVKRFINNKWLKGLGLSIVFMVILDLTNKHLFTIPDFTCGWISCIGFYLGKDGL